MIEEELEFYAVTETSLYRIQSTPDGPKAEKIAIRTGAESPKAPIGTILENGNTLAITNEGLIMFDRIKPLERQNRLLWGGASGPIVALLADEGHARECLEADDLIAGDPRWIKSTLSVARAIKDNSQFYVCQQPSLRFVEV